MALDEGRQVDVEFLDRVSHPVLLQKLCGFGISGSTLQWCESYLSKDSKEWSWKVFRHLGLPRGSLLSPLFFVIFICDLPEAVLSGSCIALYADDCKCSRIINSASDQNVFQLERTWTIFINGAYAK